MAEVVLYHHAQGQTAGFLAFADELRAAGHTVHTPDLYGGRVFTDFGEGIDHAEAVGFGELLELGVRAADGLSSEVVYAGFSLGVLPAQMLAQTRPGTRGAMFFHACVPVSEFGDVWPDGVPVDIHAMDEDPFFVGEGDIEAAEQIVASTAGARLFLYPGHEHLFADSSLASHDPDAASLLMERVLAFLADIAE